MSDGTGPPPGEDKNLEVPGAVTVCTVLEIQEKSHQEDAFNDEHFYCEICRKQFIDQCDVHGPPLFTQDTPTPLGVPQRALLTLPQGLVIGRSTTPEAGLGVFNQGQVIPVGMHFGPFDGEVSGQEKAVESAHSWVVCRGRDQCDYIDAERDTHSNWMRYVVCSQNENDQNLVAIQQSGRVLFRSCRPIYPGQELRVWYGEEYARNLSSTWDIIWDKKCAPIGRSKELASQVCLCPYCQYSFPTAYYLHRHVRRSHPAEYPNLVEAQSLELDEQAPVVDLDQCLLASDALSPSQTHPVPKSARGQTDKSGEIDGSEAGETDETRNRCGDCGRTFLRSCHLKRHQRTIHSKEKPYCCSRCRKCFSQATGLKRHQQTHHKDGEEEPGETQPPETGDALSNIYPCTECSFSFVTKLNLYKHLKRHHHGEYLKVVEMDSSEISQTEDKHDAPYEPPTKQRRAASNPDADGGTNKRASTGRPRGRPPKIKKKNTQKDQDGQSNGSEPVRTSTDLQTPAVPPEGDADAEHEQPQETPPSSHVCGECLRTFSQLHLLKSHECIQQGDGPHGCSHCELYFNRLCNLRRHERTIHAKERPYCCTLCLKSFTQSSGLKRHQESHSRRRAHRQSTALASATIYACAHCPFSFTAERYLHKHIRRHHPEMSTKYLGFAEGEVAPKEHSCTQCSKTFQTIRGFKNHACFRQGDQLYLCPDCGKAFNWFNSLKQHQRIHTGVKPYACAQCEKSFVHSGQLNVHMRTHTGEKPFLCAECGESFRQSGDLRRHEQKHSGVRPWQCPDCGKSFSRPQSLRAHQQLHKGTKLFPCTQCGKSFARRYHLTRHHQKMHS